MIFWTSRSCRWPGGQNFHLFYVFDGSGVLIVDSSSHTCSRDSLFLFPSLEVAVPSPGSRSTLTILHLPFTCPSPPHGRGDRPPSQTAARLPRSTAAW